MRGRGVTFGALGCGCGCVALRAASSAQVRVAIASSAVGACVEDAGIVTSADADWAWTDVDGIGLVLDLVEG